MPTDVPTQIPRPFYQPAQLLRLQDFQNEQTLHIALREYQTRSLVAPGIVSGLTVAPGPAVPGVKQGGTIAVAPGAAFDAQGRLVTLVDLASFDGNDVPIQNGQFVLSLDNPQKYALGSTYRLGLTWGEWTVDATPTVGKTNLSKPVFSVVPAASSTAPAVTLADLTVTAGGDGSSLVIGIVRTYAVGSTIAPARMPPLDAAAITGGVLAAERIPQIGPAKLSGPIGPDLIAPLPATKITGTLAADQLPEIPAAKITGALTVDQLPDVPAARITGTLSVDQLPPVPSDKVAGMLVLGSLFAPGIVSGLGVQNGVDMEGRGAGSTIAVDPGAAIDNAGRIVLLADRARFDHADLVRTNGQFLLSLDDPQYYDVTRPLHFRLGLAVDPDAAAGSPPILSLVSPIGLAGPPAVTLADLTVTVVSPPPTTGPGRAGGPTPAATTLKVDVDRSAALGAALAVARVPELDADAIASGVLADDRIPPIATSKLSGKLTPEQIEPLPATQLTGTLDLDQLPRIPAAQLEGPLTVNQLPAIPADKVAGWPPLTVDQLPQIPGTKIDGWPPIDASSLPRIPAAKIDGPLAVSQLPAIPFTGITGVLGVDQLPTIPGTKIDGWPPIDASSLPRVPAAKIDGPLTADQIPALSDLLARVSALERRLAPPSPATLTIVSGDQQQVARVGSSPTGGVARFAPVVLKLVDPLGQPVAGAWVRLDIGYNKPANMVLQLPPAPQGHGGPDWTSAMTGADGVAAFSPYGWGITAYGAEGPFNLIASVANAPSIPILFTVTPTVVPLTLTIVSGDQQSVMRSGSDASGAVALFAPLQVRLTDPSGNPVAGAPVAFGISGSSRGMTAQIDPAGEAMVTVNTGTDGIAALARLDGSSVRVSGADGDLTVSATAIAAPNRPSVSFALTVPFDFKPASIVIAGGDRQSVARVGDGSNPPVAKFRPLQVKLTNAKGQAVAAGVVLTVGNATPGMNVALANPPVAPLLVTSRPSDGLATFAEMDGDGLWVTGADGPLGVIASVGTLLGPTGPSVTFNLEVAPPLPLKEGS